LNPAALRELLEQIAAGTTTPTAALQRLSWAPFEDVAGIATVDHHRSLRLGFPEVIFGAGKTPDHLALIAARIAERGEGMLATRVDEAGADALRRAVPRIEYHPLGRVAHLRADAAVPRPARGNVLVITAGTSDLPVAEEAAITAEAFGNPVERLNDVGVAGLHRILSAGDRLRQASVVIVVAGMEGALPSVVGGLVGIPVIAVPTSVGYGAAFGGLAALLGMLNSCASGVTVVNIDNGFGAAVAASRINLLAPAEVEI
jgi:pyridinium-3,5-biscarboxylic acid mononucleotide synthase